ncbi:MAG: hypothetical protein IJC83_02940 [Oscillospiraceae bacterium]|nr:hypothetical protein [Oscillospiraceae bacterium]
MADYKEMYLKLFNEVTNVIKILQDIQVSKITGDNSKIIEPFELTTAIERLQAIQPQTEEIFINSEE